MSTTSSENAAQLSAADNSADPSPARVTASVVRRAINIAEDCGAGTIFFYLDALSEADQSLLPADLKQKIYLVTRQPPAQIPANVAQVIHVPDVSLTRMGQVKITLLLAMARGLLSNGETIVAITGLPANGLLDTITVMQVGREFETFLMPAAGRDALPGILPEVLEGVIDLAAELGGEGREGQPVGALFVIGDSDRVLAMSKQLILNPFHGYPPAQRNILDPHLEETIKELAAIDGAFVIRGDGVIESAGTYLVTAGREDFNLPPGLGARHHAAAAVTGASAAVAITVSQSTGTVCIFKNGRMITELEKPRSGPLGRQL